ncbi:unnamed protein product [Kuraishia capsulata CBS 1993]|uniref:glucan endo-1,3-beta-D-glucosidase n=1 Tax=Kuraishia capsulata CBS 1993 TaxID=1382522 RepID=W6MV56_9ASCO|nr:uncharacterized protein KUCA_T00005770001 [Kuraishia capsulata CBS 1993]CDK29777.1 unnamed protein product [Kuraishia capsulata CBS 1993]
MRFSASVLLATVSAMVSSVSASSCSYVDGNYYCDSVSAVVYSGIGYSGSYSDVTDMDEDSCSCSQETVKFSGTMSPLDEELSVHFRGPLQLLQFGVYYPSGSSAKKLAKREEECTTTAHVHHKHKRAYEYVEVTATVFVDQHGNTITKSESSTLTSSSSSSAETSSTEASSTESSTESSSEASSTQASSTESSESSASASSTESSATSSSTYSAGSWERVSYFEPGSTDNVTFLNTLGGTTSSGTWSSCFGNSLSYCASNGEDASSSAEALNKVTIPSDTEYMIFSGSDCSDSSVGDCGYYRSGIPAYHGFGGASKIFVFEFEMPTASSSESDSSNYDMPAIWLLNAKIPRTLQYGDSSCSCWSTGCGELDLFEILSSGSDKLISHIHDGQGDNGSKSGGAGSQDYFDRPTSSSLKAAAIFENGEVHIVVLDDDTDFGSSLDSDTVSTWLDVTGGSASL